jgi:hypothetical protein
MNIIEIKAFIYKFIDNIFVSTNTKKYFRIIYHCLQDVIEGDILEKNELLRNIHKGKRCFILATGPSVSEVDISILRDEFTFGCNFILKHKDIEVVNLKFFAEVDPILNLYTAGRYGDEISDVNPFLYYPFIERTLKNTNAIIFMNTTAREFNKRNGFFKDRQVHYVKSYCDMRESIIQRNDLTKRITFLDGSIFFMLGAAIFMGFKEIYLIGAGYTYQPLQEFHFYDLPVYSKNLSKREVYQKMNEYAISKSVEIFRVHENSDYIIPLFVTHNPVNERHQIVKRFAEAAGVNIYNIIPSHFSSPVYEGVSWGEVREKILARK